MSEIQSVEGRPIKKGLSPARRSAVGALALLGVAIVVFVVGTIFRPSEIPEDHVLALVRTDGSVELATVDGAERAQLGGPGVAPGDASIAWAPGGDFVAIRANGEVIVVDRFGIVVWRRTIRFALSNVAWSPDGRRLAVYDASPGDGDDLVATDATVDVFTTAGELEWRAPIADGFGVIGGHVNMAWSPESRKLAIVGFAAAVQEGLQPTALWIADVGALSLRELPQDAPTLDYGPAWTPAGLFLASVDGRMTSIARIDPATGVRETIYVEANRACSGATCPPSALDPLVVAPNGRKLAFRAAALGLSILDTETRSVTSIPQADIVGDAPYAWTSDGTGLLFVGHRASGAGGAGAPVLAQFNAAGSSASLLLPDVKAFDLLAAAPTN